MQLRAQNGPRVTGSAIAAGATGSSLTRFVEMPVGQADVPHTTPMMIGVVGGALDGMHDSGSRITPMYAPPFEFNGTIDGVTVDVSGELIRDSENKMRVIMARQ
jgi:arylsulfatase